jgi:hypothetical protein
MHQSKHYYWENVHAIYKYEYICLFLYTWCEIVPYKTTIVCGIITFTLVVTLQNFDDYKGSYIKLYSLDAKKITK